MLRKQILLDSEKLIQSSDYEFPLGTEIKEDGGILYYVSGYIAYCIKKSNKCSACVALVVKDDSIVTVNFEDLTEDSDQHLKKRFFDVINRGGLCRPTDALFMTTLHAQG